MSFKPRLALPHEKTKDQMYALIDDQFQTDSPSGQLIPVKIEPENLPLISNNNLEIIYPHDVHHGKELYSPMFLNFFKN